jgi:hypothetical protein
MLDEYDDSYNFYIGSKGEIRLLVRKFKVENEIRGEKFLWLSFPIPHDRTSYLKKFYIKLLCLLSNVEELPRNLTLTMLEVIVVNYLRSNNVKFVILDETEHIRNLHYRQSTRLIDSLSSVMNLSQCKLVLFNGSKTEIWS